MKKLLNLLMVLVIICTSCIPGAVSNTAYAAGTADDIISVATGEIGTTETGTNIVKYWDELGYSSMQGQSWCAAFIVWCARQAGIGSDVIPTSFSCYDASNSMKNWFSNRGRYYERGTATPQRGDLVIFKYSSGGKHIGIVTGVDSSKVYTIEGNKSNMVKTDEYYLSDSTIHGYCRPAYAEEDTMSNPVNVGDDFYAYIINTAGWKHLTCEDDGNVTIRTESGHLNQQWHFERLPDNSYKITNVWNEKSLDVDNHGTTNGTNLHTWEYQAADNQQFYIYGESGAYRIRAKCTECVFDVTGGNFNDGTNVQMWEINNTDAQLFQIWVLQTPPLNFNEINMATIYNAEAGKFLGVNENGYIELMNENGASNQVWKFERFEDGSYSIRSAYNGKYLSVENNSDENFAKLCLLDHNSSSGQQFKFYSQDNGYIIYPNCSSSRVIDCLSGNVDTGTPIQIYERNNTYAQIFRVYYSDDVQLKASVLSCTINKNNSSVTLSWNEAYGESNYVIEIKGDNGQYYINEESQSPYTIALPEGNYTATLYNENYFYSIKSNSVEFVIPTPTPETYSITLNTNGGTINSGHITSYTYGIGATLPTDVTREGYIFDGWYDNAECTGTAVTAISSSETGDKTYYAKWNIIEPVGYEIRFVNYDGVVLQRKTVTAGKIPSYTGVTPEKAQDEYYTYTFSGWSPSITAAQLDTTYTAQFTQTPRSYSVTLNTNGGTLNSGHITSYTYGEGAVLPTDVKRDGYTFCGWYDNSSLTGTAVTSVSASETGDKVYYAKWERNAPAEYTITFVNYDGSVLQSENVTAGTMPVYSGETPERPVDNGYSYTFSGWSPTVTAASRNATYTAQFTKTARVYSIKYDTDGGTINSGIVTSYTYGIGVALPTDVNKPGYIFNGWYTEPDFSGSPIMSISATESGSKVYYAKWTQDVPTEYLISFVNYDNIVLQSSYVPVGETPEYYGAVPARPADNEYTYTFVG